jgi:Uma2 family endonuclease
MIMITNTLIPPEEKVSLSGISWETYQTLLTELSNRKLRLIYYHGNLQIMVPSPEHELYKEVLGRFVETLAEELDIKIYPLGSTTFKRPKLSGAEPDKCFYIQNLNAVKGKKRIDTQQDPPPDLVIEIDITSFSDNSLEVYRDLQIPEVWIYHGTILKINLLQNQQYIISEQSLAFPNLPILEITQFLEQSMTRDYLDLVKAFRCWVKSQISNN